MVDQTDIEAVETTEDYYRFQFRDRDRFEEVTDAPEWAEEAAENVSEGASVRMGRVEDSDNLQVDSVDVPQKPNLGKEEAKNVAEKILEEIHSR